MLESFLGNPTDPKYQGEAAAAAARFRSLEGAPDERGLDREAILAATIPYGVGAVTLVLIGISLALAFLDWVGFEEQILRELLITRVQLDPGASIGPRGLSEIGQGEFWRLLTPALVNFDVLPLLFNTLLLLHLGSMIEGRLSPGRLGLLFIVIGVLSNLAQYYISGPKFCGVGGVLFGLLGYIWMRGRLDPATGLFLRPQTVALMLIFYVIGLAGAYGGFFKLSLGTAAQSVGLGLGLAWGFLSSLPALRQRT
jgi:GlpG protein